MRFRTFLARRSIDSYGASASGRACRWSGCLGQPAGGARGTATGNCWPPSWAQSLRWGVDLAAISPAEAAGRTGGYYHAAGDEDVVWCPEDVYIEEPGALIDAYLAAARRAGVRVLADEPVTAVSSSAGAITGVATAAAASRPGLS